MKPPPKLLSKTKIMKGYRCTKSLYLTIHHPDREAPITPDTQALFDQGNQVGEEARKHFPGGTLVDNKPWDFIGSLKRTRELLENKTEIIYEAAFEYKGCYARADIIQYSPSTQRWKIFEVKSSTKIKEEHLDDVGLQTWIMAKSGLPIEQINVMHLNAECHYPDLTNLFVTEDVTNKLRENYLKISPKISEFFTIIQKLEIPPVDIGEHCIKPHECGFKESCWKEKNIPENSVLNLPKAKNKWELYAQGILKLDDPRLLTTPELSSLQQRVIECFQSKKRFIDSTALKTELKAFKFPLIFLDFETIAPAIPRYDGTTPYQQVPFQFSVHIWPSINEPLTHKEFLHTSKTDPRPTLIPALLEACCVPGTIVSYFAKFESDRIKELAEFSPQYKEQLESLLPRMVDPLPILREHVYDNAFQGSFSLKAVAPALLGDSQSYEGMEVANGTAAQRAFEELISDGISQIRKAALIRASLEYCKKDTYVMVELVKWLFAESLQDGIGKYETT